MQISTHRLNANQPVLVPDHVSTAADRLPDRGNRRDAVSPRRAGPDCRGFRILRRPPEARRDKPRVSAFTSADIPKIVDLAPDLVLSFSDLQADIVAALIRTNIAVHAFNQRTIAGIFEMICMLGAMVGAAERADRLADELEAGLAGARRHGAELRRRPLVYFEEWDEPMISGIAWVSELIEIAGGADIFADRAPGKSAKQRIVTAEEIIARRPEIIIGSWCGKKFRPEKVASRPGFDQIPAVSNGALYEIKSPLIL